MPSPISDQFDMRCQLCRIESEDGSGVGRIHTVHEGVDISLERRDVIFAAVDAIMEDMEQEELNFCLQRFQRLFALKGNLVARFHQLSATGDLLASKRLNSEIRAALFEWLQAVRAYLDHTEARIKRQYGKTSKEAARFRKATGLMFDGFFAYRFVYKLRNAQHVDFSQVSVVISESVDGDPTATVRFNRDALLEGYDGWGSLEPELTAFPEHFFIDEPVFTMMQCLTWLAHEVAEIDRPTLERNADIVNSAIAEIPAGKGYPSIVCVPDDLAEGEIQWRNLHPVQVTPKDRPKIAGRPSGQGDDWIVWDRGS